MGGVGSGRTAGKKVKVATERLPFIDIHKLQKQEYLQPNTEGSFSWSIGETKVCSIGYRMRKDRMEISYNHKQKDGQWVTAHQEIIFDETGCNYGGKRRWFLCGHCNKRVAILYYQNSGFYCRHCHNLTYASQQENEEYRMIRKTRKIRERLGASDNLFEPIWEKPKGMHQKTFDRLCKKANTAQTIQWKTIEEKIQKSQ